MMLAFLLDQIQEASSLLFQRALAESHARMTLWETLRNTFKLLCFETWDMLFALIAGDKSVSAYVVYNSSNTS